MDLRKKIKVSSYHRINIPLGESYTVDDEDGNETTEYGTVDRTTLSEILSEIETLGIPSSEFENIHIFIDYENRHDPSITVEYRKQKTQEEMDKEMESLRKEYEKKQKDKERAHQEKNKKKTEKQKIIASLTPEQRKALGYDGNSLS